MVENLTQKNKKMSNARGSARGEGGGGGEMGTLGFDSYIKIKTDISQCLYEMPFN